MKIKSSSSKLVSRSGRVAVGMFNASFWFVFNNINVALNIVKVNMQKSRETDAGG